MTTTRSIDTQLELGASSTQYVELPDDVEVTFEVQRSSARKIKTRFDNLFDRINASYGLLTPFLFINALRRFWQIQPNLLNEVQNNKYYTCNLHPQVITAISYDGATVSSEAFGITTPLVFLTIAQTFLILGYELARYCKDRKKLNELIQYIENLGIDNAKDIRMLDLSSQQIKALHSMISLRRLDLSIQALMNTYFCETSERELSEIARRLAENGMNTKIINTITARKKTVIDQVVHYREELNYYLIPIALIAVIPGLVVMQYAAKDVGDALNCNVLTYIADTCSVADQYDMLSLEIYPWMTISLALLGWHSLGMTARLFAAPFPGVRSLIHEKIHTPFQQWSDDKERWRIQNITWGILSIPAFPAIIAYSAYKSLMLIDQYARETGCQSVWKLLISILKNDFIKDSTCSPAQAGIIISGFLGDFEVGKLYSLYLMAKFLSYFVGMMLGKISCMQKATTTAYIDRFLEALGEIHNKSKKISMVSCILAGSTFCFFAKTLADHILHENLEMNYSLTNFNLSKTDYKFDNNTLTALQHALCPYDQLDLSNLTFANTNLTSVLRIINNSTIAFRLAPACPQYDISSIFLRNLIGSISDCKSILVARSIGAFVGLYWTGVSSFTGASYVLSSLFFAASCGISSAANYLKNPKKDEPSAHPHAAIDETVQQPFLDNKPKKHSYGCFSRVYYRFFKAAETRAAESELDMSETKLVANPALAPAI